MAGSPSMLMSAPTTTSFLPFCASGEDVRTTASAVAAIGHLLLTSDKLAALARSEPLAVDLRLDAF